MTGSPYSYYSRDPGSPYPYDIGDLGTNIIIMDMGTRGPQNGGSPFSHDTGRASSHWTTQLFLSIQSYGIPCEASFGQT